jgi:2-octaprenyl-6-methoxyphenol hydroxylase
MDKHKHLIITGGGILGSILASRLAQKGWHIFLVDPNPLTLSTTPRAFAISFANAALLRSWGLGSALRLAPPIRRVVVSHAGGVRHLSYCPEDVGKEALGFIVDENRLKICLQTALNNSSVKIAREKGICIQQESYKVQLQIESGKTISAPLIVGADGACSFVQQKIDGPDLTWDYEQEALTFIVKHAEPHHFVAYEHFAEEGPLAFLPLRGRRSAVVWSMRASDAQVFADDPCLLLHALIHHFGWGLGTLKLASSIGRYPLSLRLPLRTCAERLVTIGDAAHRIHPLAGQGLNLGLRDVGLLEKALQDAVSLGLDPGSSGVLEAYTSKRRWDIALMTGITHLCALLPGTNHALIRALVDGGFWGVSHWKPIKSRIIRHAMGLGIDPSLDALCNNDGKVCPKA